MPKLSSIYSYTVVIIFALLAGACSSLNRSESDKQVETSRQESSKTTPPKDQLYEVGAGDTLSGIALETTGDVLNWRKIAELNNISDPNTIRKGQFIVIPHALTRTDASPPPAARELNLEPDTSDEKPLDTEDKTSKPRAQDIELSETGDPPAQVPLPDSKKPIQQEKVGGWLIIRGGYYPREINIGPDSSSDILTQAWPGTRLQFVDRADGWYKVITNKGHGYLNPAYATVNP